MVVDRVNLGYFGWKVQGICNSDHPFLSTTLSLNPYKYKPFHGGREINLEIWEQRYAVGLSIRAKGKEDQGAIAFNNHV
jgi:hypothetical protein